MASRLRRRLLIACQFSRNRDMPAFLTQIRKSRPTFPNVLLSRALSTSYARQAPRKLPSQSLRAQDVKAMQVEERVIYFLEKEQLKKALEALADSKKAGVRPTVATYNMLMRASLDDAIRNVKEIAGTSAPERYLDGIMDLYAEIPTHSAERKPDSGTFGIVLETMAKAGDEKQLEIELAAMEKAGVSLNVETTERVLAILQENQMAGPMIDIFGQFVESREPPTASMYVSMITALGEADSWPHVYDLYDAVLANQESLGRGGVHTVFQTMFRLLGRAGRKEELREAQEDFKRLGYRLSQKTGGALMTGYASAGEVAQVKAIAARLPPSQGRVSILHALGNSGDVAGMLARFDAMLKEADEGLDPSLLPDRYLFHVAMQHVAQQTNKLGILYGMMGDMERRSLQPDATSYGFLMRCAGSRMGNLKLMMHLHRQMTDRGITPTAHTHYALVQAFAGQGELDAMERADADLVSEHGIRRMPGAWAAMMAAYGKTGRRDRVHGLWRDMRAAGTEPDVARYNCLLRYGFDPNGAFEGVPVGLKTDGASVSGTADAGVDALGPEQSAQDGGGPAASAARISVNVVGVLRSMYEAGLHPDKATVLTVAPYRAAQKFPEEIEAYLLTAGGEAPIDDVDVA